MGNTALHLATTKWTQDITTLLLRMGANVGMKNRWNQVPITSIAAETLEAFLDDHCLTSNCGQTNIDVGSRALEITFDYNFLAPPSDELPSEIREPPGQEEEDEESGTKRNLRGRKWDDDKCPPLPETESLWHIGQSKSHRHLLKHPVITSFLWCKWTRIRRFFNRNLRFYLLFVYVLTWYIFDEFDEDDFFSNITHYND